VKVDVEDGRHVLYAGGTCSGSAPRGDIDKMPSANTAWIRDPDTEGQVVLDNGPAITKALAAHNATVATPGSGCGCALRARPREWAMIAFVGAVVLVLGVRRRRPRARS